MAEISDKKIIYKIEISLFEDGQVSVSGPLTVPTLFFDLMNLAERIVLDRVKKQTTEEAKRRIITPNPGLAGGKN